MPSYTDTDRNAIADGAPDYDGIALLTDDAGTVASGGTKQTVTLGAAGVAGPNGTQQPATVGRRYTTAAVSFTLAEQATHIGAYVGATLHRVSPLRTPLGPGGPFPIVYAVQTR
jgi:hypothetical protein